MTTAQQNLLKKKYLERNPFNCHLIDYSSISFPYCSLGYDCKNRCNQWFYLYRIDFERFHKDDPNKFIQLELF